MQIMHRPVHPDSTDLVSVDTLIPQSDTGSYKILAPIGATETPVVFSSPHSGRAYPEDFLQVCQADLMDLRRIEDAYVDELANEAPSITGAPLIQAMIGRACVDLNRAPNELDATMFTDTLAELPVSRSPRVAAGLGCIPRIAHAGTRIYRRKLSPPVALQRLEQIYRPYHKALQSLVDRAHEQFGVSFLIDLHSMPSCTESGVLLPDIILGDRFGAACSQGLTKELELAFRTRGYSVARNAPYAGGHITLSMGRPQAERHAIQIEINRRLYLDEQNVTKTSDFQFLKADIEGALKSVSHWAVRYAERKSQSGEGRQIA